MCPGVCCGQACSHLQHELTVLTANKDELPGQPVAGPRAAHQEPGGHTHLHRPAGTPHGMLGKKTEYQGENRRQNDGGLKVNRQNVGGMIEKLSNNEGMTE